MSRAALALGLAAGAAALAGCETSAEKSAKLEKQALIAAAHTPAAHGLTITHPSAAVRVLSTTLVSSREGTALVVTLGNTSAKALRDIPLAVYVKDARGATVYTNTTPGAAHTLVSVPYLPPHGVLSWVDDQVQATVTATSASATAGAAPVAAGAPPQIALGGVHPFEDPTNGVGAEGTVSNRSSVGQQELVVYVVARRGARIVAAGRAVLPQLAAGATTPYRAFFVGSPAGATLTAQAPPTTLH